MSRFVTCIDFFKHIVPSLKLKCKTRLVWNRLTNLAKQDQINLGLFQAFTLIFAVGFEAIHKNVTYSFFFFQTNLFRY